MRHALRAADREAQQAPSEARFPDSTSAAAMRTEKRTFMENHCKWKAFLFLMLKGCRELILSRLRANWRRRLPTCAKNTIQNVTA